ncbi:hypothetical protein Efla_003716 [Eimeria flavescens]
MVANTYIRFDSAQASSFFPSVGHGGQREFSPDKALTRGSGYWCSEGNHRKEDVVSWTVAIAGSFDGAEPFQEVVPFQDVNSAGRERAAHFLGAASPYSAYKSDERGDVVLEGCLTSIAAADERALWQFTEQGQLKNPVLNICVILKDNVVQEGGQVVADNCEAAYAAQDGRSVWYEDILLTAKVRYSTFLFRELQPNNQLKLLRGGNYCLSQLGSKAGSTDIARNSEVRSSHSRSADAEHGPSNAVDGKDSTFWASQEFQKDAVPETVLFDVDFGDKYKMRTIDIDWEYPPLSYSISASVNGVDYVEISRNNVNTLFTTMDDTKAVVAQYLRVRLEKPHPSLSVSKDMYVYGIKTLSVYSNRLRSIVEPCSKAKASADARDKFFLELVTEVDLSAGIELQRAGQTASNASAFMTKSLSGIEELIEPMKNCLQSKEAVGMRLAAIDAEVVEALGSLSLLEEDLSFSADSFVGPSASSSLSGLSKEHPIEDCYSLKSQFNKGTSGFYWVLPLCAPKPLRAYCDISSGGTYVTIPDNDGIISLNDAVLACAKIGLEPVHLRSNRQITALQRMLDIMEMDLTNPVPVAVNNGANVFYSLDFKKDVRAYSCEHNNQMNELTHWGLGCFVQVTEFIVPAQQSGTLIGNTVGLSPSGLIFFDSSQTDMSTIICSTNKDAWNPPQSYLDITCLTAVGGNASFDGPPGTTVFVRCPEGCIHYVDEVKVVGGEAGVYAEESSICLAAIHAGLLSRGGDVSIRVSPAPTEFEGTDRNGIVSSSFFVHTDKRAFIVESVARQCPADRPVASSFLELSVSQRAPLPAGSGRPDLMSLPPANPQQLGAGTPQPTTVVSAQNPVTEEMNELTVMAVSQLSTILSQRLGGLSMEVIEHLSLTTIKYEIVAPSPFWPPSQRCLCQALQRRAQQSATDGWSLDSLKNAELADVFDIYDSKLTSSAISPTVPGTSGTGTYTIVKNKNYFDFVLAADVFVSGSGSVGVAFRVGDRKNMFLFEMKQQGNGGSKRLLRIVNGVPTETAKLDDGGYVEGQWYHVEVQARLQRISVRVSEISESKLLASSKLDIDLLDGSFMSGSVGFFTSAVNSACFDRVTVKPLPCTGHEKKALLPPYPPRCSNYKESFVGRISEEWLSFDPPLTDVPSHWKYATDVGGEHMTIAQMAPAILSLARHRSCDEGLFSFKFFPQCEGVVGAVFNLQDHDNFMLFEMGPSFARLRRKIRGAFSTVTKSTLWAFKPGSWNTITVFFNRSHVVIKAGDSAALPVFSIGRSDGLRFGSVGLSTWRCAGVAFASVFVHPPDEKALVDVIPAQDLPAFEQIQSPKIGLQKCIGSDSLPASEFENSKKARSSCTKHCGEAFKAEALVCEELGKMREACAGTAARSLYTSCSGDAQPDKCTNDVCKMCCATYKTPMDAIPAYWAVLYGEAKPGDKSGRRASTPGGVESDSAPINLKRRQLLGKRGCVGFVQLNRYRYQSFQGSLSCSDKNLLRGFLCNEQSARTHSHTSSD